MKLVTMFGLAVPALVLLWLVMLASWAWPVLLCLLVIGLILLPARKRDDG